MRLSNILVNVQKDFSAFGDDTKQIKVYAVCVISRLRMSTVQQCNLLCLWCL